MAIAETITNETVSPSATAWRIAVSEYERAKALRDPIQAEHSEAEKAFFDRTRIATPEDFATYSLEHYARFHRDDRAEFIRAIELVIVIKDAEYRLPEGGRLTDAQLGAITAKATRLVDDFIAFRAAADAERQAANKAFEPIDAKWTEANNRVHETREALLKTPAPDASAVLFKLDLLAAEMVETDEQDAPAVAAIRDDARRLFGGS